MKVLIKDENNKQVEISPSSITINGKSLASLVQDVQLLAKSFNEFKAKQEKREEELHKMWRKIKDVKP